MWYLVGVRNHTVICLVDHNAVISGAALCKSINHSTILLEINALIIVQYFLK